MDSIRPIGNPNLGVLAITEVATENSGAVPPLHLVTVDASLA
jgi:hypothetical protein